MPEIAEKNAFIAALLEEFARTLDEQSTPTIPEQTDGIVILSWEGYKNPEHASRLTLGIKTYREVAGKSQQPPIFVINAETEQLPPMKEHARELGMEGEIALLDCGPAGVANSKTQIDALASDSRTKHLRNIVLITSDYHVPRVARTASKGLPETMNFLVLGARGHDSFARIYGEIMRIVRYSEKGDISKTSRAVQ
jgi:hypothetical protein